MVEKLEGLLQWAEGILLTSPQQLRYFTGFRGGEGIALVGRDARFLFVDSRYTEAARKEASAFTVIETAGKSRIEEIGKRMKEQNIYCLAFEDEQLSVAEYEALQNGLPKAKWQGCSRELETLRMVKTAEEIQWMRTAEQIGIDAFLAVIPMIKPGVAEHEVAAELEYQMRRRGGEGTSFETIVVSGVKSSMPHGRPDGKKIERGDFVTMDFGCRYQGYCSDMTRTVVVGKASAQQKEIYETVRLAQQKGLDTIQAGILGKEADRAARQVIEEAGYGRYFGHSLGHGVGLLIHELPNLSPASEVRLEEGMVVTCEPGIYLPGFGGVRIEDMVLVTKDGIENLTPLEKSLLEL